MQKRTNSPSNPVKEEQSRIISLPGYRLQIRQMKSVHLFGSVPAKSWHKPDKHRKKEVHAILYTCIHVRKVSIACLFYIIFVLKQKFAGECARLFNDHGICLLFNFLRNSAFPVIPYPNRIPGAAKIWKHHAVPSDSGNFGSKELR